jgi:hypothetical protein
MSADMKALLAPLRQAYQAEVRSIAQVLAPRFRAREFDNTRPTQEEWENDCKIPFLELESLCMKLSLCETNVAARAVTAVSKYADDAEDLEGEPNPGRLWKDLAAWCLCRDVHDEAIRQGSAKSVRERLDPTELVHLDEPAKVIPEWRS